MNEKPVVKKKVQRKRRRRTVKKIVLVNESSVVIPIVNQGFNEKALMLLTKIFKSILNFLERRIKRIRAAKLADKMKKK